MIEVAICVGSACHLKGSPDIVEAIREEIEVNSLEDFINLKAAFCLGHCGKVGVTVQVQDEIYSEITKENVHDFFENKIMPLIDRNE